MELFLEQIQGGEERLRNYQNCWFFLLELPELLITFLSSTGGDIVANKNCEKLHYMWVLIKNWCQNAPLVIGSIGEVVSSKRSWSDSKKGAWEMLNWSLNICITQGPEYLLRRSRNCCGLWQNHCQHFKVTYNKMLAKYWKWPIWWCYFNKWFLKLK